MIIFFYYVFRDIFFRFFVINLFFICIEGQRIFILLLFKFRNVYFKICIYFLCFIELSVLFLEICLILERELRIIRIETEVLFFLQFFVVVVYGIWYICTGDFYIQGGTGKGGGREVFELQMLFWIVVCSSFLMCQIVYCWGCKEEVLDVQKEYEGLVFQKLKLKVFFWWQIGFGFSLGIQSILLLEVGLM